ncbi:MULTISPECIES: tonB-system energizer ExbB [unclassified Pseudoalteromonas]|uniref:tonB-system energizer ExbB n=1 Tax=unclassified Pseudoalteromonas TaxID=194690 RepID=UPI0020982B48|nr:tonB-system energizer ExbB [Pseudoalteromonas sp. XMcav2-N]MCO7188095.1 tonB-system energizer ExbB [Pseudoalteromonas sp. XMcav2-N]
MSLRPIQGFMFTLFACMFLPGFALANSTDSAFAGHDLSPWGMYMAADFVVKSVMIGLVLASVATWGIWLLKTLQLNKATSHASTLLTKLVNSQSFKDADKAAEHIDHEVMLLMAATKHELELSGAGVVSDDGLKERIIARLERVQTSLSSNMNQGTGVLATVGSVAPFVGLFGTVWGIMNSFIGIAETQTTNLAVVAPGIAEALLATAIGLVAAIPAVVIYNHFSRAIAHYSAQTADIVTAVMVLISRDLDRTHPQARAMSEELNITAQDQQTNLKAAS